MISAYLLGRFIQDNNGHKAGFEQYAEELMREVGGITNLQLAPGGVIENIYPATGHQNALGYDIFSNPDRKQEAMVAVNTRRLTIVGPINLVQGGIGVIGRYPVFLETKNGEIFWGLTSVLVTLETLLASTDLPGLADKNIAYQLWHIDPHTQQKHPFAGQIPDPLFSPVITSKIKLPNKEWCLDITYLTPPGVSPGYWIGLALCLFVAILFTSLLYVIIRLPQKLEEKVSKQTQRLAELAFYDSLTKLPNRKLLHDRLLQAIHKQERDKKPFALLFLDIDTFKTINDTLGHEIGDKLLMLVAERLQQRMRKTDTAARLGGDEFTLVLTNLDPNPSVRIAGLMHFAQEILDLFKEPFEIKNHKVTTSVSIGITLCPDDGTKASALLRNADLAMYHAKQEGKNCFHFFSESMNREVSKRLEVEQDLHVALREDQFSVVYQPILSLATGEIIALEALLRWQHPDKGFISPALFIPVAEESGQIKAIGGLVLSKATRQIRLLNQQRERPIKLNINLSPKELRQPGFTSHLTQLLKESEFPPELLSLELTESALMENFEASAKVLHYLKSYGISLAIDDFGTGYSSLSLLKKLPVDNLKIDRMFIQDIPDDDSDMEITAAIILMARKLGLTVTAEGVETPAQAEFLRQNDCHLVQGFFYCKPLPLEQLEEYLAKTLNQPINYGAPD